MAFKLKLSVDNKKAIAGLVKGLKSVKDFSDFHKKYTKDRVKQRAREVFAGDNNWPALDPSTIEAKGHSTILIDSKDLFNSYTSDSAFSVGSDEILYGSDVPYADYHETGTSRMPKRSVLEAVSDEKLQSRIASDLEKYLGGIFNG